MISAAENDKSTPKKGSAPGALEQLTVPTGHINAFRTSPFSGETHPDTPIRLGRNPNNFTYLILYICHAEKQHSV